MRPPVHFAARDDGLHVHQGGAHIIIPRSRFAAFLAEFVKILPVEWK